MVHLPAAADWQPPDGAGVILQGLAGENAVFNGCHGHVVRRCGSSQRLLVCMDESGARLRVQPRNVSRPSRPRTRGRKLADEALPAVTAPRCVVHLQPSNGKQLGFGAGAGHDGKSLLLTRIDSNGLLGEWNAKHPTSAIQLGDRIMEVNGRNDSTQVLVEQLRSQGDLNIVFQRVSLAGSPLVRRAASKWQARADLPAHGGGLAGPGGERRGDLIHNLKRVAAQLEKTIREEECWGRG
mmetsp:Transcript_18754/g.58966  ORF Transcript_18754/g.58966 Transcript_18754/m.58966 type:complete len:239 (+) Transcript_18754:175-891(+)